MRAAVNGGAFRSPLARHDMTTKADFPADEWQVLMGVPWVAGILIVMADAHITGMVGEFRALWRSIADVDKTAAARELVNELVADMDDQGDADKAEDGATGDAGDDREELLAFLAKGSAILHARCTPQEAADFRDWVLEAAWATAEASKESVFFGVGGDRVSGKETSALAEVQAALGS